MSLPQAATTKPHIVWDTSSTLSWFHAYMCLLVPGQVGGSLVTEQSWSYLCINHQTYASNLYQEANHTVAWWLQARPMVEKFQCLVKYEPPNFCWEFPCWIGCLSQHCWRSSTINDSLLKQTISVQWPSPPPYLKPAGLHRLLILKHCQHQHIYWMQTGSAKLYLYCCCSPTLSHYMCSDAFKCMQSLAASFWSCSGHEECASSTQPVSLSGVNAAPSLSFWGCDQWSGW